ncbi:hypothetical protein [Streptomyces sp. Ag109_G2-15]|uniref:hypothetical protein n=1 Tax=Streptomyces sp. Ag109_G2-15 TaxID=1938850 RepID=UPI000BD0D2C5|nr:hypothetical protein [Streptomyces sp. Ag109_G2-15]SOD86413.1 hypothetical protein SAMN06272765_3871 [Streptomyces sp. Ag109_G2-15]
MPDEKDSEFKRSGRLFAAVAVLRLLADPRSSLPGPEAFTGKDSPARRINDLKSNPYHALLKARKRGEEHTKAATAVFRSIPDFLERDPIPSDTIGERLLADFTAGYEAQLAKYREDHEGVLD